MATAAPGKGVCGSPEGEVDVMLEQACGCKGTWSTEGILDRGWTKESLTESLETRQTGLETHKT